MALHETRPFNIFVSYCHRDQAWLDRVQVHLRPLARDGLLDVWDDRRLQPGADWKPELQQSLKKADAAVLLISADFLASEFIASEELPPLLGAADVRGTKILPVIVGPSLFSEIPALSKYQAVNPPTKPLASMQPHEADEALLRLALSLRQHAEARRPPTVVEPGVAHSALQDPAQPSREKRIVALIERIQSKDSELSACVSEALGLALETQDSKLMALCQRELAGYSAPAKPGFQPAPDAAEAPHRVLEFHVSIGTRVDIDYFGSSSAAIDYMQAHPDDFPRMKFLFPEPIGQVERNVARSTADRLLQLSMPARTLVPTTNIPDTTVFLYANGSALTSIVDGLKSILTASLIAKLQGSQMPTG
jgi:hypothetical protein